MLCVPSPFLWQKQPKFNSVYGWASHLKIIKHNLPTWRDGISCKGNCFLQLFSSAAFHVEACLTAVGSFSTTVWQLARKNLGDVSTQEQLGDNCFCTSKLLANSNQRSSDSPGGWRWCYCLSRTNGEHKAQTALTKVSECTCAWWGSVCFCFCFDRLQNYYQNSQVFEQSLF